jgi:hypothetical protein
MRKSSTPSLLALVALLPLAVACSGGASPNTKGTGQAGASAGGSTQTSGAAGDSGGGGLGAGTTGTGGAAADQGTGTGIGGDTGAAGSATGVGGATGAGGATSGTAGAAGTGMTSGAAGAGTGGSVGTADHASGMSAGCGKTVTDPAAKYVEHDITVTVPAAQSAYAMRKFFTYMPHNYDPSHPYPVTMWGPGCGASGPEGNQLMGSVGPDGKPATDSFIEIQLLQKDSCFSTSAADSPEVPYFDEVLKQVSENYCIDKGQVFVAGYSSGSWLTHLLGCQRGNVIRGIGSASGGILVDHGTCTGPIAAIMTADTSDTTNPIIATAADGTPKGSGAARDRILMANGCQMTSKPWNAAFPGCEIYDGCPPQYPVVWCLTMGQGHSTGGINSSKGFWTFWSTLPKLP